MTINSRLQLFCVWAGPAFVVLYGIFFWGVAGFIPPTHPTLDPAGVANFYADNRTAIRVGQIGAMVASTLLFPFFTVISLQIARIERRMPVLAVIQFGGAVLLLVFFAVCSMLWITASFRPEADPATVRTLHDLGWLIFVMVFPAYCLQMICQAIAGFIDKSPNPTWPRWAAYFNLWVAFSGVGGGLAVFFKTGPFAWNGLIGFYTPLTVFAIWLGITTVLLHRAIKRQDAEEQDTAGPTISVAPPEPAKTNA
jgi:hypothetical protein